MSKNAIKVSELNSYIKKLVDMDYLLKNINVIGEISNLKKHSNGNIYFSLKDEKARINAIVYGSKIDFDFNLEEGLSIIATGVVSLYEKEGQINFYVDDIEINGEGNLYRDFLKLKKKLAAEGLFDSKYKKKIKKYPKSIGLITSDTGAAIRDVLNILYKRNNLVDVFLYPSFVQGKLASERVIRGIKFFNENKNVDTIVITRGGGSFEDLQAFNDEDLAREIFASKIPIISAIGHEIDFCISDFVADLRASTPTNATELVTGSKKDLINELNDLVSNLFNSMDKRLYREKYLNLRFYNELSSKNPSDLVNKKERLLYSLKTRLDFDIQKKLNSSKSELFKSKINLVKFNLNIESSFKNLKNKNYYLNKNLESKINFSESYLSYSLDYLNRFMLANLRENRFRNHSNIKNLRENNILLDVYKSKKILDTFKNNLSEDKIESVLNFEKSRMKECEKHLNKVLFDLNKSIKLNISNNRENMWTLNRDIYDIFKNYKKALSYNLMNLNDKFNKISKIELKNGDGKTITTAKDLRVGEEFTVSFKDGNVESVVKNIRMRSD